ncbi:hypothetical protein BHF71_02840 [Vulcanibacillus modesticaldus]|uniref:Polysaccharide biosynthesis protein CapD-like domain-containing protein n=1 Tax=Vulcanibacillus modesticaldus TaxID=337097 RepID=A0A1D2YT65_9BACI|nr:polysaccharide biosynthesis protein [Vulcanibacillus modesticaldus]OEF98880.1 hypothetical protein BHF71_02840 [Vulcanibacillus modesticaldus]
MYFKGKKVLIIGGTGSIGQKLVSKILQDDPTVIRVFSRDEYKQFKMQNKIGTYSNIRYLIGDIRDYDRIIRAMQDIDYVFHLAAMKHVPSCEYNPFEAVQTNIIGTNNVIRASLVVGAKRVVFTSTDKAISPTNTYGATKLTAERLILAAQYNKGPHETIFTAVRFGNVIGSRGSVIPLFKKQILEDKKITVTDLNMTRFMMTVDEAVTLTIKALKESQGKEIFIFKMPVIRLKDLVTVVLEEVSKKYKINMEQLSIEEIGLRPGEKMFEELMTIEESRYSLELPEMFIVFNGLLNRNCNQNRNKSLIGSYSSHNQQPLALEEVRELILSQDII